MNGAGIMMSACCSTIRSRPPGSALSSASFAIASRTAVRCFRSSYGQAWMTWFSGPKSVCQKAPSVECFSRSGFRLAKRSSNSATVPGRSV